MIFGQTSMSGGGGPPPSNRHHASAKKRVVFAVLCASLMLLAGARAQTNHFVRIGGGHVAPYTNWTMAAANINAAITASAAGAVIWVTNGVYDTGGTLYDGLTNRVFISKAVTVRSVNGPSNTVIAGRWHVPGGTVYGDAAVRCVYLTNGAVLIGFTLTNGSTRVGTIMGENYACGGGLLAQSTGAAISNCVLTCNRAHAYGAGARYGSFYNCRLTGNVQGIAGFSGAGGGANYSTLYNCELRGNTSLEGSSGGTHSCTLYSCVVANNTTPSGLGGGALWGSMYSCIVTGNVAVNGGGTDRVNLYNCTVAWNTATGVYPNGGVNSGNIWNSIVYYNVRSGTVANHYQATNYFSCTTPMPAGQYDGGGNITNEPMFVDMAAGNLRLALGSPCGNVGTNFPWMSDPADARSRDVEGRPRLRGTVDMGAYEQYITPGTIFFIRGSQ